MLRRKQNRKTKSVSRKLLKTVFVRSLFKLILALGLIYLFVAGISRLTHIFLSRLAYFTLSKVYVKDHFLLQGQDAFEFSGLKRGVNLFDLDLQFISQNIKHRHPEYENVIVKRVLPDRIDVLIKERKPVMQIKLAKFYPVDKNGFVIPYAQESAYLELPIIIGIDPKEVELNNFSNSVRIRKALELLAIIKTERFPWQKKLSRINLSSLNDISLFLDNGTEVKIGSNAHLEKLRRLDQILDEIKARSLEPGFIDLRFKDVIIAPK